MTSRRSGPSFPPSSAIVNLRSVRRGRPHLPPARPHVAVAHRARGYRLAPALVRAEVVTTSSPARSRLPGGCGGTTRPSSRPLTACVLYVLWRCPVTLRSILFLRPSPRPPLFLCSFPFHFSPTFRLEEALLGAARTAVSELASVSGCRLLGEPPSNDRDTPWGTRRRVATISVDASAGLGDWLARCGKPGRLRLLLCFCR